MIKLQAKTNNDHPVWKVLNKENYEVNFYPVAERMYDKIEYLYNNGGTVTYDGKEIPIIEGLYYTCREYGIEMFLMLKRIVEDHGNIKEKR